MQYSHKRKFPLQLATALQFPEGWCDLKRLAQPHQERHEELLLGAVEQDHQIVLDRVELVLAVSKTVAHQTGEKDA